MVQEKFSRTIQAGSSKSTREFAPLVVGNLMSPISRDLSKVMIGATTGVKDRSDVKTANAVTHTVAFSPKFE